MIDLILGTAGHIDHGKTSLIRALTGTDTDRLPEEKRRGITIELGFAELAYPDVRLGIVDVPGHERFLRQMLAGATGMDMALLVVAADDSVKPQTREHMEVLRMLKLSSGVIVLTKCDLADADWMDLVEQEVRELTAGSFLEQAPVVRTSAVTGMGIAELKSILHQQALEANSRGRDSWRQAPFRMAIDRVFSLSGHGTVVTGSVASGSTLVGNSLLIQPQGIEVRVRSLQNHDRSVDEVHRGQRAAINLAGVHPESLTRGHELCAPGYLFASQRIAVSMTMLGSLSRPFRRRTRVRVHMGTAEVMAEVQLLDAASLLPGAHGMALLRLAEPLACHWDQPFVVRSESPVTTIGGGRVLVPVVPRIRPNERPALDYLAVLAHSDAAGRMSAAIYFSTLGIWSSEQLYGMCGIPQAHEALDELVVSGNLIRLRSPTGREFVAHPAKCLEWETILLTRLSMLHERHPLATMFEQTQVTSGLEYLCDPMWLVALLELLAKSKRVCMRQSRVGMADRQPKLTAMQTKVLAEVLNQFEQGQFQPPTLAELQKAFPQHARDLERLMQIAEAEGNLVRVSKDLFLAASADRRLRDAVHEALAGGKGMTVSELREILGTTRKFAVPFCEYLDRCQVTRRDGDVRKLAVEPH
jgi:selenocysteine-specific elongation factor